MHHRITTAAFALLWATMGAPVHADPTGIDYTVYFDGTFTSNANIESHKATVTFDGVFEPLPHVPYPGFELDPPDVPASDLLVSEMYDGVTDVMVLWIEGPGSDAPMFNNPIDLVEFDIQGLHWGGLPAGDVVLLEALVTFSSAGGPATPVAVEDFSFSGAGLPGDPLNISVVLDETEFNAGAVEFHASFAITHVPVPPALPLLASGLIGFASVRRSSARKAKRVE